RDRPIAERPPAYVLLEDGAWFPGTAPIPFEATYAEVVFTTNLSGYQEVFTDPSYLGQIVVMTAPMIGNYGINPEAVESDRPPVDGRARPRHPSDHRAALHRRAARRPPPHRGVRLRHEAQHRAAVRAARLRRDGGAGRDERGAGTRAPARRLVPVERPRRPGSRRLCHRHAA